MSSRRALDAALLAAATGVTRFVFRSHYLYDVDSVNFALAMRRFDPRVHQPHPPGYFLYVYLGSLVNLIFHDANAALVAISIAFSCGAAVMIYILTDNWFGRQAALFAGLIFLFSPLAWFHGIVALTYIVEAFFSCLVGYLCWRIFCGEARLTVPAALALGIAAGFRPSSLVLLAPLLLFSFSRLKIMQAAAGIGALTLTTLAWLVPMLRMGGGYAYLSSLASLWLAVPSKGTIFNSSVSNSVARAALIAGIYLLAFGCAALVPLWGMYRTSPVDRDKKVFIGVWVAPGLLFFTFVFLKVINSGYLLVLAPPVCALLGTRAADWYANAVLSPRWKRFVIGACAAANTTIFIFAPVYSSFGEVRRFERELGSVIRTVPELASPLDTMIVGFDSHFLGYRHAGYYLPRYLTVQFPEVSLISGTGVFMMRDGDTRLENRIPTGSLKKFILFPLPLRDREYIDFLRTVRKRIPPGHLHTVTRADHAFSTGPITDLSFLFPASAR
jgi:hypothetical protein